MAGTPGAGSWKEGVARWAHPWPQAVGQGIGKDCSSLWRPRDVLQDPRPNIVPDYKGFWPVAFTWFIVSQGLWEPAPAAWLSEVLDWGPSICHHR